MGFDKREARICMEQAHGNVAEGMVNYIVRNGCNGFKCKGCVLGKVCSHKPLEARSYAAAVLAEVDKRYSEM